MSGRVSELEEERCGGALFDEHDGDLTAVHVHIPFTPNFT